MLRKMYPKSKIGILVRNYNYDVVKNLPYINEVIKIDDYKENDLIEKIQNFQPTIFIALFSNSFVLFKFISLGEAIKSCLFKSLIKVLFTSPSLKTITG